MKALYRFFHSEAAGGIVLFICACLAVVIANSPLLPYYARFLSQVLSVGFVATDGTPLLALQKPLLTWINDLGMAVFFLYAGAEIKREMMTGALASMRKAALPIIVAVYGMMLPAFIFIVFVMGDKSLYAGWAIPAATDIAFAIGVLALAASRVPPALKALLMAIAVIDDLGAVIVIAFFYSGHFVMPALYLALAATLFLVALNRMKVSAIGAYILTGIVLWAALLESGIHPTMAGVITGLCIPHRNEENSFSPLERLIANIHPWVVFGVLPVFGFCNAGVSLSGIRLSEAFTPVVMGVAFGLFLGKQVGIMGAAWLAVRSKICALPEGITWRHMYGIAVLCGIGFTMALFIGALAFDDPIMQIDVRLGVLVGSVLSAVLGYAILRSSPQIVPSVVPEMSEPPEEVFFVEDDAKPMTAQGEAVVRGMMGQPMDGPAGMPQAPAPHAVAPAADMPQMPAPRAAAAPTDMPQGPAIKIGPGSGPHPEIEEEPPLTPRKPVVHSKPKE